MVGKILARKWDLITYFIELSKLVKNIFILLKLFINLEGIPLFDADLTLEMQADIFRYHQCLSIWFLKFWNKKLELLLVFELFEGIYLETSVFLDLFWTLSIERGGDPTKTNLRGKISPLIFLYLESARDRPTRGTRICGTLNTHNVGWDFLKIWGILWDFLTPRAHKTLTQSVGVLKVVWVNSWIVWTKT